MKMSNNDSKYLMIFMVPLVKAQMLLWVLQFDANKTITQKQQQLVLKYQIRSTEVLLQQNGGKGHHKTKGLAYIDSAHYLAGVCQSDDQPISNKANTKDQNKSPYYNSPSKQKKKVQQVEDHSLL